ncbi:MAG: type II toxin-antitoxin system prevent-host-death family antitoxin [Propionibacteriaceae bacterium]|jgi:prevent-host-death family protein|nr:type II toxin-antitoxin system prevent-host-death family antitoxin [Propionibacteriaceae bacterium]
MTAQPIDEPIITVGQLRQNPSQMIHDVRLGQSYVLTDRGVPTARIVPYARPVQAVPLSGLVDLLNAPDPAAWQADRRAFRDGFEPRDPWLERPA